MLCPEAVGGVGPSPPARGSPSVPPSTHPPAGSIPACAGEPSPPRRDHTASRVHPRLRGGAPPDDHGASGVVGPSPPARGSREVQDGPRRERGSIPACAGEPTAASRNIACAWVHPRLRGGALTMLGEAFRLSGPSPPARGSPTPASRWARGRGSIPACAGEPHPTRGHEVGGRVHPRLRGGAPSPLRGDEVVEGPSPPARGSPKAEEDEGARGGSIPACAGEPTGNRHGARKSWVHPRLRGGATVPPMSTSTPMGPSPPARGSHTLDQPVDSVVRSIPACAGEPRRQVGG